MVEDLNADATKCCLAIMVELRWEEYETHFLEVYCWQKYNHMLQKTP